MSTGTVDWKLEPTCVFMHNSCYIKLCSPRKLAQAEKRKEKQLQNVVSQDESSFNTSSTVTDKSFSFPPPKRTCSAGIVHDKAKCIWCFKGPDKKPPNRKSSNYTLFLHSEHGHLSNTIPIFKKMMKFERALQL